MLCALLCVISLSPDEARCSDVVHRIKAPVHLSRCARKPGQRSCGTKCQRRYTEETVCDCLYDDWLYGGLLDCTVVRLFD